MRLLSITGMERSLLIIRLVTTTLLTCWSISATSSSHILLTDVLYLYIILWKKSLYIRGKNSIFKPINSHSITYWSWLTRIYEYFIPNWIFSTYFHSISNININMLSLKNPFIWKLLQKYSIVPPKCLCSVAVVGYERQSAFCHEHQLDTENTLRFNCGRWTAAAANSLNKFAKWKFNNSQHVLHIVV